MKPISRLQYITTTPELAEKACQGGIDWIQLRLKNVSYDEYLAVGKEVQKVCRKYGATFIINDLPKLAMELDADGVHVGKEDPLPQEDINELLRKGSIIGVTCNDLADLEHLSEKKVSYIGLGPFRFTTTKQKLSPVLGLEGYKLLMMQATEKELVLPPIIGIGGILPADVQPLLGTGLHGIAISGAISDSGDVSTTAKTFKRLVYGSWLNEIAPDLDLLTDVLNILGD